jgi:nicotinate-nucleotide pyrophosphorylase (carboxylating)
MPLPSLVDTLIDLALAEDLAYGDLTSDNLFLPDKTVQAFMVSRDPAVVSGLVAAQHVFIKLDPHLICTLLVEDGDKVTPGTRLMQIEGALLSILKGERTALNLLQHLSGVATLTYQFMGAMAGTRAKITHTRKTTPGLRSLEIQAVLDGGGFPHRKSLSHAVMLKDNHLAALTGGIIQAVHQLRDRIGHTVKIEVECDTLTQVDDALTAGADILLLDNMSTPTLAEAVSRARGRAITEASGGITLSNVAAIARTGVDYISTSQLTLSAPAMDIGLDISNTSS